MKCIHSNGCELIQQIMSHGDLSIDDALGECVCDDIGLSKLSVDFNPCSRTLLVFLNGRRLDNNIMGRIVQYGECPDYGCQACRFEHDGQIGISLLNENRLTEDEYKQIIAIIEREVDSPSCGWCE
jgi:hypothetical protein